MREKHGYRSSMAKHGSLQTGMKTIRDRYRAGWRSIICVAVRLCVLALCLICAGVGLAGPRCSNGHGIPRQSHTPDEDLEALSSAALSAYHGRLDDRVSRTQAALAKVKTEWESVRADLESWVHESQEAQAGAIESMVGLAVGTLDVSFQASAQRSDLLASRHMEEFDSAILRADERLDQEATKGYVPMAVFQRFDEDLRNSHEYVEAAIHEQDQARKARSLSLALQQVLHGLDVKAVVDAPSTKFRLLEVGKIATEDIATTLSKTGNLSGSGLIWVRAASSSIEYAYSGARFWVSWQETGRLLSLINGGSDETGPVHSINERVCALDAVLKGAVAERKEVERAIPCVQAKERMAKLQAALAKIREQADAVKHKLENEPSCESCASAANSIHNTEVKAHRLIDAQRKTISETCRNPRTQEDE